MKIGIFIGRMQPIHLGHQLIIKESIDKNDFTLILLGSSGLIDQYNPFSDIERKDFIEQIFIEKDRYMILYLPDMESDEDWLKEIKTLINIQIETNIKKITFYGGDFENDYAIKIVKKYKNILDFDEIYFKEISRKNITINHNSKLEYISSTLVRESLKNKDFELLEKLLDKSVFDKIKNAINTSKI